MTPDTTMPVEKLEEILKGLEGVTPGPWYHVKGRGQFHLGWEVGAPNGAISASPKAEVSAHIARLDPDTVRSIITELLALRPAATQKLEVADTVEKIAAHIQAIMSKHLRVEEDEIMGNGPASYEIARIYTHPAPQVTVSEVDDAMVERAARKIAEMEFKFGEPTEALKTAVDRCWPSFERQARAAITAALSDNQ